MRTAALTVFALIAFAANSLLCRMALEQGKIDPATFTSVRILAGAALLACVLWGRVRRLDIRDPGGSVASGGLLFVYAAAFSFAYVGLGAGTGALILFGTVQATMLSCSIMKGERPTSRQWAGLALAISGLVCLVLPGLSAPPLERALLMAAAGIAWGLYSLRGRRALDPTRATAANFVFAAPFGMVLLLTLAGRLEASPEGLALSVVSGALTSGLGYVIWYAAIPELGAARAAIVQLSVPILAAAGGILLLGEEPTLRLAASAALTLGGAGLAASRPSPATTSETARRRAGSGCSSAGPSDT